MKITRIDPDRFYLRYFCVSSGCGCILPYAIMNYAEAQAGHQFS